MINWPSLFVIGDIHGHIPEYLKLLASLPPGSRSIALGDMYLGRPGVNLPELPPEHKFIRGNHDDPKLCREHPNYLGDFGYLPDDHIFFLSGAFTVSAPVLQNSAYWYKDEELSAEELETAIAIYREMNPQLLLSHEGPSDIVAEMLGNVQGSYHEAKRACVKSRTAVALQRMIEAHAPPNQIFAHHHRRWIAKRGPTTFRCLKESEVCEC
jgi:hypothetical protein